MERESDFELKAPEMGRHRVLAFQYNNGSINSGFELCPL
jgi:hypothetical protein